MMKHKYIFFLLFIFFITQIKAGNVNLVSSNLPIVIITTDVNPSTGTQYTIVDEPKVPATMKIIYHPDGSRNYVSDQNNSSYLNYNGKIGIEIRGTTSQWLEKKPYGLTTYKSDGVTNNNVSILGMPKENDWVLNSLAFDGSLIRDYLSYDLYRDMGNYSPREQYCEVIVNGDYKGLYIFMEKLKVDENRINVTKMTTSDIIYPAVSGGYVTKSDKTTGNDPVAWTMYSDNGWGVDFIHDYPKPENITREQKNYIYNVFQTLMNRANAQNSSIENGFPDVIDIPTFIDFMIMSELASNVDSYQYSTYYHKDRRGKLRAGPIWDYNLTYGLDVFANRSLTTVWQFDNDDNEGPKYWKSLFNNATFKCYLSKRWSELITSEQALNKTIIYSKIDNIVSLITEAAAREQTRWGTVGNLSSQISSIKYWLSDRMSWMDARLSNYTACANVSVPQLVISKINYHPTTSVENYEDSLEFIEITNNSNETANLTGIYFRELGVTYRFPNNSTLLPNQKICIASDSLIFKSFYGIDAFGQYDRNLSNKSEHLMLVDAFGNIIDDVNYADSSPWPTEADGNGYYLQLINPDSDNSIASNWMASNSSLTKNNDIKFTDLIVLYPIPTKGVINIISQTDIQSYEVVDLMGRVVKNKKLDNNKKINITDLPANVYFVKLHTSDNKCIVKRIMKN
ncbi:Secreted protein with CotH, lamin and Por secretion system C-terminal sorting domains (fragment) [uncultured Paludibacter sp.]|uniref:Secreted protein with CotH, lamin and Por secretion system C-terminal sorting domains n=1 Tax=uncultured Paludibacter sp. TaxID=497635 RepID=A0A653AFB9_9BACT